MTTKVNVKDTQALIAALRNNGKDTDTDMRFDGKAVEPTTGKVHEFADIPLVFVDPVSQKFGTWVLDGQVEGWNFRYEEGQITFRHGGKFNDPQNESANRVFDAQIFELFPAEVGKDLARLCRRKDVDAAIILDNVDCVPCNQDTKNAIKNRILGKKSKKSTRTASPSPTRTTSVASAPKEPTLKQQFAEAKKALKASQEAMSKAVLEHGPEQEATQVAIQEYRSAQLALNEIQVQVELEEQRKLHAEAYAEYVEAFDTRFAAWKKSHDLAVANVQANLVSTVMDGDNEKAKGLAEELELLKAQQFGETKLNFGEWLQQQTEEAPAEAAAEEAPAEAAAEEAPAEAAAEEASAEAPAEEASAEAPAEEAPAEEASAEAPAEEAPAEEASAEAAEAAAEEASAEAAEAAAEEASAEAAEAAAEEASNKGRNKGRKGK